MLVLLRIIYLKCISKEYTFNYLCTLCLPIPKRIEGNLKKTHNLQHDTINLKQNTKINKVRDRVESTIFKEEKSDTHLHSGVSTNNTQIIYL